MNMPDWLLNMAIMLIVFPVVAIAIYWIGEGLNRLIQRAADMEARRGH